MFSSNTSQVSNDAVFVEDVFSTYLYTGNSSSQTITNGIDLAGKGGMVWVKQRNAANNHALFDTSRGTNKLLYSNTTSAQVDSVASYSDYTLTSFNSNGFTLGNDPNLQVVNTSPNTYASWTFRKQPKFFDVVTYTGNGTSQTINHNLGSTPGFIICKSTTSARNWLVYHKSLGATQFLQLDTTIAATTASTPWNNTAPTSTTFTVGSSLAGNENGQTFVAYLFADNAGGFGLTGTDNVISCGSFTQPSSGNATITLGYEPQWVLIKRTDAVSNWFMYDIMRGMSLTDDAELVANTSGAEGLLGGGYIYPTSTGFVSVNGNLSAGTYIYIAIRRGPMKTPTSGTSVYNAVTVTGNSTANRAITGFGFPLDLLLSAGRTGTYLDKAWNARLTDAYYVRSTTAAAEDIQYGALADLPFAYMDGYQTGTNGGVQFYWNYSGDTYVQYGMRRAPSFMDVVCYSGTGSATTVSHNLGVAPELMIIKSRSNINNWDVYAAPLGNTKALNLESTGAAYTSATNWNNTTPGASTFTLGTNGEVNGAGQTYVAYLFASCPGVSKVGSYSGTGATQTISCGFAARFVLIKRTNGTGNWWVWDTARGMVAGTDPRLAYNSTAVETNANWVYTNASGFQIVTTDATVNANGGSYIYLAIA